jgi:Flp pilus assembly protein TadG
MDSLAVRSARGSTSIVAGRSRRWPRRLNVVRDRKGATTLEFAIVALLFVFWLLSLITFGLDILAQAAVDAATQTAGRQIQIGAIRGSSADPVRSLVCASLQGLSPLCSGIQVYATSGVSFSTLTLTSVIDSKLLSSDFSPGGSQSYVLLQVSYDSPFTVPLVGASSPRLVSTIAFRNEP